MTLDGRIALLDEMIREGIPDGVTLRAAVNLFQGALVAATLKREGSQQAAARDLGCTRENVYKIRVREGLPVNTRRNDPRPIPADFRERLTS